MLALVITIIIIIILATVTINFIFGENGLVKRAEQAKLEQEIATARETLTMILGDAFAEKKINPKYDQNEFLDKFIEAREPNVYLEEDEIGLNGHIFGLDRSVPELGEYQGELTGPRIKEIKVLEETTNSASIEVITVNAEGATYEYWHKNDTEGEDQWKKVETDNKSNRCTVSGLTQGETYNIRVVVTTSDGSATGEVNVYLGEIPEGTITFTPAEWVGDGTAKTTINTSEIGYTLQYQIVVGEEQIVDTNWQTATPGQTIEGLHHNETVYGRLFDGINESKDYGSIAIKDEENPIVNVTSGGTTTNSITVNVVATDGQSGMKEDATYTYSIKQSTQGEESYTTPSNASNLKTNTYTFTGLTQGTSYDIKVVVDGDRAGKIGEGTLTNQVTKTVGGAEGGLTQGNIIASSPTWAGRKASITLTTNTGLQIQYQVGSTTETWTTIQSGGQVTGLNHNDTVYARLWDGNNAGSEASVTIKDEIPPTINSFTATNVTYNSITVQVNASDAQTGLNGTYTYYLNGGNAVTSANNSCVFNGLADGVQYSMKVDVSDIAGNLTSETIVVTTIKDPNSIKNKLKAGNYVNYIDGTGITRKCVVLYGPEHAKYSSYGIQIIPMECVEDMRLNVIDNFNATRDLYNNVISTLNNATQKYLNTTYAVSARCVGSVPDNPSYDGPGMFNSSYEYMKPYNGTFKDTDNNYVTDWNQLQLLNIHNLNKAYWLASRGVTSHQQGTYFTVLDVYSNGILYNGIVCYIESNGSTVIHSGAVGGLRPVFTLKPGLKVTGGSGTENDPYTLGV